MLTFLFSDLLNMYLGLKLLSHIGMPYYLFGGTTKFLHILTNACCFPFLPLDSGQCDGCEVVPCDFDLHFPSE